MPTHAEKKVLPYTPEQMYRLVADVEKYPEFLPWCLAARIRRREGNVMFADLVIGFKMVRERFTSRVELDEESRRINVQYTEGPFQYLNNHWLFTPHEGGVCVDFYVDFEFRSKMLQKIMGVLFNEAVRRMVQAFETRANQLYGAGSARPAAARTA
ncbi:type II toxin-antitoxin system RatA family toxin [Azospirillum sp. YIM DDC1]|uniref:Type II toxin-antitoxin system RatA family toxin n=1 Tax=Azospirillum aestuarii TaxID=2802052 RepID=A0ABS1HT35_9PROT|nr:type II toxin-antitoxin system RatA family toxin [Azospirillum aestuarii]MBK3772694.1 type II toxin-antitoxin system RatA family toxin [Azospirillum brasilense]MBK4717985.1 type II toxin-antitoxin system RatA family toxin [Azospirillum aestuarii]TWA92998.1 coenzyme Q-binding protein COQ10 [Azospirillum brasilense]